MCFCSECAGSGRRKSAYSYCSGVHKDFPGTDAQSWQSLPAAELQDQDYIVDLDDSQLNMTGDPYGYYIVDFYEDGTDATATYSNNGILVASQVTIDDADLPQAVSKAMHEQYPDWQITKEKEVIKNLDKTYYKVTIQKDNEHQTLYLNEQGVMIDKKSM